MRHEGTRSGLVALLLTILCASLLVGGVQGGWTTAEDLAALRRHDGSRSVFVAFLAPHRPQSRALLAQLETVDELLSGDGAQGPVEVLWVDCDAFPAAVKRYGLLALPALRLFLEDVPAALPLPVPYAPDATPAALADFIWAQVRLTRPESPSLAALLVTAAEGLRAWEASGFAGWPSSLADAVAGLAAFATNASVVDPASATGTPASLDAHRASLVASLVAAAETQGSASLVRGFRQRLETLLGSTGRSVEGGEVDAGNRARRDRLIAEVAVLRRLVRDALE